MHTHSSSSEVRSEKIFIGKLRNACACMRLRKRDTWSRQAYKGRNMVHIRLRHILTAPHVGDSVPY